MCFDLDSRPPIEPIAGGALEGGPVVLEGEDGARFKAFGARPANPTGAGIVILPDVRGLHPFFEELALRFAERGVAAVAIDYFGRTAGTGSRSPAFEYQPHVAQIRWDQLSGDIRVGTSYLRSEAGGDPKTTFATGFCLGGRLASLAATLGLGLSGVIPFYGWPTGASRDMPAPAAVAHDITCPVLAIYGGADQGLPAEVRDAYDNALAEAGVEHRTIVYPNAPHSFFDRKAVEFADEARSAWEATLAFIADRTT